MVWGSEGSIDIALVEIMRFSKDRVMGLSEKSRIERVHFLQLVACSKGERRRGIGFRARGNDVPLGNHLSGS